VTVFILAHAAAAGAPTPTDQGNLGEETYMDNCAMCHEPDGAGIPELAPPLIDNPRVADAAYLEKVIREGISGPLEVSGVLYDEEMPAFDVLTDVEIEAVVAFVLNELVYWSTTTSPATTAPEPIIVGTAAIGTDLFLGRQPLQNGGPACVACHTAGSHGNLGGRGLGPDLTDLYTRFGGDQRTAAALRTPPDDETGHLLAFFSGTAEQEPPERFDWLLAVGLGGAVLLFGVMVLMPSRSRESYVRTLRSKR
jgi:mono/diheme cytochrome c family protein